MTSRNRKNIVPAENKAEVKETVAVKETVVPEVKTEEKKTVAAPKKTAKTTTTKATTKKSAVIENIFIQQNDGEVTTTALVEKAKADSGVKSPEKIDIYVRPEINMVYYVINGDKFGSFELC